MVQLPPTCQVRGLQYSNTLMVAGGIVGGGPSQAWLLQGIWPNTSFNFGIILQFTLYTIQAAMIVASQSMAFE